MKNNKGITLIALIITIIVMLILVAVTVNYGIKSGLLSKAKEGKISYEVEQEREKIASRFLEEEIERYTKDSSVTEEKIIEPEDIDKITQIIAEASIATNVDSSKFFVWYDKGAINYNKTNPEKIVPEVYVFYDWNSATIEEIEKLEAREIEELYDETNRIYNATNRCFVADLDGDRKITNNDSLLCWPVWEKQPSFELVSDLEENEKYKKYKWYFEKYGNEENGIYTIIGDVNGDIAYDGTDLWILEAMESGEYSFYSCADWSNGYYKDI